MSGSGKGSGKTVDSAQPAGEPAADIARCPICGKPRNPDYRPFCSKRCADVDLGRWLKGSYAIPVTEEDDEDGDEPGADGASSAPGRQAKDNEEDS
jgi:endogenous inhibitor of DNA gyrase (YacG/DUF329 family)